MWNDWLRKRKPFQQVEMFILNRYYPTFDTKHKIQSKKSCKQNIFRWLVSFKSIQGCFLMNKIKYFSFVKCAKK